MSASSTGQPSKAASTVTTSRVVPGVGSTIARSYPASALRSRLLPTFGRPASTTLQPSSSRVPTFARSISPSRMEMAPSGLASSARPSSRSKAPSAWSSRISATRSVGAEPRRHGRLGPKSRTGRVPGPGSGAPDFAPSASSASTTRAIAAGPPWHWTSTSGGLPASSITTATTSSPSPAPIRPTRSRPGGDSASPRPR